MTEVIVGTIADAVKEPISKLIGSNKGSQILTLLLSVTCLAWILLSWSNAGRFSLPAQPLVIGQEIFKYFAIPLPSIVGDISEWMRGHPQLMRGTAVSAGVSIGLSATRSNVFASGGGAIFAWIALLVASESLNSFTALTIALITFFVILIIGGIFSLFRLGCDPDSPSLISWSWGSWRAGLAENLIQFLLFPFLPMLLSPWLISGYGTDKRQMIDR